MKGWVTQALVIGVGVIGTAVVLAQGGVPPPPPQEGIPGRGTQARMLVVNRDKSEAIPVTVVGADPIRANITGTTIVRVDAESQVNVRSTATRQAWEYRTIPVAANDPTGALNSAGADGWEL